MGGAAAGQSADDDGPFDRNGFDFGMRGDQCFQPEPIHQVADQLFERDRHAGLRQAGLITKCRAQQLQALAEFRFTPLTQTSALRRGRHQRRRREFQRGAVDRERRTDRLGCLRIHRVGQVGKVHRFRPGGCHLRTSSTLTTRQTGRCGVSSGRNQRNQIRPLDRPAVDTQLGWPGSVSLTTIRHDPSGS